MSIKSNWEQQTPIIMEDNIIDLIYHSETPFIYDLKDWRKLRTEFRIVGIMLGHTLKSSVLPLQLLPEESLLLINKNIGRLVSYKENQVSKEEHDAFKTKLFEALKPYYIQRRHAQLMQYIDKIVAGKRKKGVTTSKEEIFDAELARFKLDPSKLVWPIIRTNIDYDSIAIVDKEVLLRQTSSIRYETFKDLWEKKFYLTPGHNYGGDFLVYPGDPILYHSYYIVSCLEENQELYPTELVALGRVATSVKKKGVLSYMCNGKVNYITIKWIGK